MTAIRAMDITPSRTATTALVVMLSRIALRDPKRETTSPTCRFSKKCSGSRMRWSKRLVLHCTMMLEPTSRVIQDRSMVASDCSTMSTTRDNAISVSRS